MEAELLVKRAGELAADELATDIVILDLRELSDVVDYFVIVSGMSYNHLTAISRGISRGLREAGESPYHREGETGSNWVLLDYIDVVVHIFLPSTRQFYALEELWGDAPITKIESPTVTPAGYESSDHGDVNGDD